MQVTFAHLRERSVQGGWVNFAVFDTDASNRTSEGRALLLSQLTARVRSNRLAVDQSALAFIENGRISYFGSQKLVDYLKNNGVSQWTHKLDV